MSSIEVDAGWHYRAVFEHPSELIVVLDAVRDDTGRVVDWRYRDANGATLSLLQRSREAVVGQLISDILPERATRLIELCAKVLNERKPYRYEATVGDTQYWICLFAIGDDTVVSSGTDITERSQAERETQRLRHIERAEKEWLAAVLDSMTEEVYFTDTQMRYTYANPAALREFGHQTVGGLEVGQIVSKLEVMRPDGSPRPLEEAPPLRALRGEIIRDEEQIVRTPRTGELRHRHVSSAPVRDVRGEIIGSVSVVRDVTEQKRVEAALRTRDARVSALLRLADEFRSLTLPSDVAFAASRLLGETLGASRCGYGTISAGTGTLSIEREWRADALDGSTGSFNLAECCPHVHSVMRGDTVVCDDVETDPRTVARAAALKAIHARSFVNVPVMERDGVVAMLYLSDENVRRWQAEELDLIREVAERTRIAFERRRSEQDAAADLMYSRILRDLAGRLIAEGDPRMLFDEILEAALAIAAADAGTMQLLNGPGNNMSVVAIRGIEGELGSRFDVESAESQGLVSSQRTPLVSRTGRPLGMLFTHWRTRRTLEERELRFLDLLARQAADLIERAQSQAALRSREMQLREADHRKDEFIAILAHELRNPLVPIRAGVELLKRIREQPALIDTVRPMMERQVAHMVRLIDDLLDVSRVTSGKFELQRQNATLSSLVGNAIDANREAIRAAALELDVSLADPHWVLNVDPTRFVQVLSNLLQNATKFTAPGGRISISAVIESAENLPMLSLTVSDTGVGIPGEMLPRIFELFAQGDGPGNGKHGGLGIGLALARRIVELHDGTLNARSAGPGRGAQFTVRMPVAPALHSVSDTPWRSAQKLEGLRVLIVDDNRDGADSMALLIGELGAQAAVAYDGVTGLSRVQEFDPHIVLLDIGMPGMDGYETCRRIRASGTARRIAIVALTGWGQARDKQTALESGFDAHLTKPAAPQALESLLASFRTAHALAGSESPVAVGVGVLSWPPGD